MKSYMQWFLSNDEKKWMCMEAQYDHRKFIMFILAKGLLYGPLLLCRVPV